MMKSLQFFKYRPLTKHLCRQKLYQVRFQSNQPPTNQPQTKKSPKNFYQLLNLNPDKFKDTDLHKAYEKAMENLAEKMGAHDGDLEDLMEEMMAIDKAYKTLKNPMTRRDYTLKLKAGKLDELDDADSHYQDLFSDLGYQKFKAKNDAKKQELAMKQKKLESQEKFQEENFIEKGENMIGKNFKDPLDYSKGFSAMIAENQKYVGYVWTSCLGIGLLMYGFSKL